MKPIQLVDLKAEANYISDVTFGAIQDVIRNGDFVLGKEVQHFELLFAESIGVKYAVGVKSGTSALYLGLRALGIGKGDEVITSPLSFIASGEAIHMCGATPVFCDVNKQDGNISASDIEGHISDKTKAVLGVHLYGNSCENDIITEICSRYNLFYIEDAAQAFGSQYKGKKLGCFGDIGCFSFMPAKVLGAYGDAGAITTDNKDIYEKLLLLRNHGRVDKNQHICIGYNERIDTIQAAVLSKKMPYMEEFLEKRKTIARKYLKNLSMKSFLNDSDSSNCYVYVIQVNSRNELQQKLQDRGISTGVYYPKPIHLQHSFGYLGYKQGDFPVAEQIAETNLAIPIHPFLTTEEQDYIIDTLESLSQYNYG